MYSEMRCKIITNLHFIVPGIHVNVVNSYAAASLRVPVKLVNNVDLPTDGNPTNPIRVSPLFVTSNPRSAFFVPALFPPGPFINSDFNLAILAFNVPKSDGGQIKVDERDHFDWARNKKQKRKQ